MRLATLLMILLLSPLGAAAQTLYVTQTSDGFLNMRSGPGTRFDVTRRLSPGDRVDVQQTKGVWYYVRLPSGDRGWVSGNYLERGRPATGLLFVAHSDDGYLNLRGGPGTNHEIVRRMYPGDRLEALDRRGRWVQVRHVSGAVGWAYDAYLTR
ncbi:N-acetylmuramoyl-L-alanine amidase [Jannaschia faecimaris]|uniref:N-acetylmuramoyl-L-alanine amidase n=1 Tax=Jannaschia faecimaris TaxID=1244108 RepID=A0A1H3SJG5_9RHOB|nr:SH3 domain-containing protein [Jannaschia faecimaris]SDZ38084.1 N-acetylmuramoyl-L-alanine amidase [Jannaschia faecimaris]